jgi:mycothiol synthase
MSDAFTIRPATTDDVEVATGLLNEHSQRLYGVDDTSERELRLFWGSPDVDLSRDVFLAEAADGSVVGYADVGLHGERVWLDIRAFEPESVSALLAAVEARAAEKEPGVGLMIYAADSDETLPEVAAAAGYELVRHSFRMEIALNGEQQEPSWPEGVSVRTMRSGEEKLFYDAHNASFADTWLFSEEPFDIWSHWFFNDPAFDPTLWFVAEAGDEVAGIAITRDSESDPTQGWVRILGVLPDHRRRGLGEALLRHAFREHASRGKATVGLGVDAQNPTGAVRLYERAGMHVARKNQLLEKLQG